MIRLKNITFKSNINTKIKIKFKSTYLCNENPKLII